MCCYYIDMCGSFLRQVVMSIEDKGGDYNCKKLNDGYNFEIVASIIHGN